CPQFGFGASSASALCPNANPNWTQQLDTPGAAGMMYAKALFTAYAWQNLVPDWNHTTLTAGFGSFGGTDYVTAGRASDGSLAMAYLPSVRTVSVNMAQFSGSSVNAFWYDPSNGTTSGFAGSPFANSGARQFTPPNNNSTGGGDWVLVLQASGQAAPTSTPTPTAVPATATPTPKAAPT